MNPSSEASNILPFKFRPRRENVDWQRINAVNIDLVMSQLDVDALQENISTVTFCSLDRERCQHCRSPVDQALVKLFQLAQLTVEWVLHCQECLTLRLHRAEESVAVAGREREELLAQQKKQREKVKDLISELKQRKKIIQTQQTLIKPGIISQKCPHCENSYLDSSFLESHMHRRHPEECESKLHAESERKSLVESLTLDNSKLKEQILQHQQELQAKSLDNDTKSVVERLKLEISSLKEQIVQREQELQTKTAQDEKWENTLQEIKAQLESEKNHLLSELSKVQSSVSDHEEHYQRLQLEMDRKLQEKEKAIKALEEQLRNIPSNPSTEAVDEPEETTCTPQLDPIQEPSNQEINQENSNPPELVSSSLSEKSPLEKKPESSSRKRLCLISSVMEDLKEQLRLDIKQALMIKLGSLGVKPNQKGLKKEEHISIQAKLLSWRESFSKGKPDYWCQQKEIARTMEQKLQNISSSLSNISVDIPGIVSAPAPELKPKRIVFAGQVGRPTFILDPIKELPEDEYAPWKRHRVTSIFSEMEPKVDGPWVETVLVSGSFGERCSVAPTRGEKLRSGFTGDAEEQI